MLQIEHFTVHDMRRTARTHLARLGVDRFVAERSLNHKLGNVEGVYDRHDYFPERHAALGAWAALLASVERGMATSGGPKASRVATNKTLRPLLASQEAAAFRTSPTNNKPAATRPHRQVVK